jgi:hypothetical protein
MDNQSAGAEILLLDGIPVLLLDEVDIHKE